MEKEIEIVGSSRDPRPTVWNHIALIRDAQTTSSEGLPLNGQLRIEGDEFYGRDAWIHRQRVLFRPTRKSETFWLVDRERRGGEIALFALQVIALHLNDGTKRCAISLGPPTAVHTYATRPPGRTAWGFQHLTLPRTPRSLGFAMGVAREAAAQRPEDCKDPYIIKCEGNKTRAGVPRGILTA